LSWSSGALGFDVGFRHSGMHAWLRSHLVFSPLGVFFMTLLSGYLGIFFVRGSPHYLVLLGRVGFIYKAGRKPVSRVLSGGKSLMTRVS
jgi:hypothetical protein